VDETGLAGMAQHGATQIERTPKIDRPGMSRITLGFRDGRYGRKVDHTGGPYPCDNIVDGLPVADVDGYAFDPVLPGARLVSNQSE
jgi:hypothetical protein